jgi:hypothetical protein
VLDDRKIRIEYLFLMDPDPGGPKTHGSDGSGFGSATLHRTIAASTVINKILQIKLYIIIKIKLLTQDSLLCGITHKYGKEIRAAGSQTPNLSPELFILVTKGPVFFSSPSKR